MGSFPNFGAFILRAQEKDGRTCINGLPVASPAKQMLGRFPYLQSLQHDNLSVYLHFSETVIARDLVIVVMEHYTMNLEDILKTGNLKDESLNNNFYSEISSALDYLHTRNIVHGFLHLNSIYITDRKNQKLSVKLSGYGLPFLTNYGKDTASSIKFGAFLAPERILNDEDSLFAATYQSDVWELGFIILQIYLGISLEAEVTETEYLEILNKYYTDDQEKLSTVMEDLIQLLADKKRLPYHKKCEWLEAIIRKCLQMCCSKRCSITEVAAEIEININGVKNNNNKYEYKVKTVEEMRAAVRKEVADNNDGFEKLSVENSFYLWKTCGSTPEIILLKKGIIQNHAPISSYPTVRFDDFLRLDSGVDSQSTFEYGVFDLPSKKTLTRKETGQRVSARMFHKIGILEDKDLLNGNILYETASNMLTVDHLLNASAVFGISSIISRLTNIGVIPTQRADVWCTLLDINETKWRDYLNLDVLASHSSDRQLEVDIPRCHQYDSYMTTPAIQESLRKVLKGWQIVTESQHFVYWQGCDSLATPFLLANMSKPHVAFACFKEFTYRYCHKFYLKDNSEVIKEYLGIFYHLVAYTDPVLYKHLKINGFDAELFAIPWFLTCFAHELPLSKLVLLWDETMMHGNAFPLMIALAMLNRLRDKLLAVNFNEMIIIIHDQPDLSIDEIIKNSRGYEKLIPPSCTFRAHASPWKENYAGDIYCLPNSMAGLSLQQLSSIHCPRMSSEELIWRIERKMVYVLDTRQESEFQSERFSDSFNHPNNNHEADIDWLRFLPGIVCSELPKCFVYGKNDKEAAERLTEAYVMKGVPYICLLHDHFEAVRNRDSVVVKP
ncbi:TBC domain-containing protein kinase-like protein [Caenorhabditis elegans]|uniref:TBC domain-containing protein kinase-like protein n=1 Tax=Caenorhabditis elegans TaxID=6239 RepID=Q18386_CAEEL|nr:TBC domain-containing protein kinase-like protein [Caenorhabditis elegans]CCD66520.2 TBC domain-containing protein kinase-like protein [Caenorhabditis elegans]